MIDPAADTLHQIVSLFQLTQPMTIPQGEDDWAIVEILNLPEVAALSLALSFFLRQRSNRVERLRQPKDPDLVSVAPTEESYYARTL